MYLQYLLVCDLLCFVLFGNLFVLTVVCLIVVFCGFVGNSVGLVWLLFYLLACYVVCDGLL